VIFIYGSDDIDRDLAYLLIKYNIKATYYHKLNSLNEQKILVSIMMLSDEDFNDPKTLKVIFQMKKNDIPIIAIYKRKEEKLSDILSELNIISISLEQFEQLIKLENKFFINLYRLDIQYEKDIQENPSFNQLYHELISNIFKRAIKFI
jgi:hypothetical protein